jgi:hypothetical protein
MERERDKKDEPWSLQPRFVFWERPDEVEDLLNGNHFEFRVNFAAQNVLDSI